tara:strand:+ start:14111 stop:14851 length:741 start_codon:yes stop_codon:yes gene_type:complete
LRLIKLSATNSTNSFLKELAQNSMLDDYTVVTTNDQTSGRGQRNNHWVSEPYKNLTFSTYTTLKSLQIKQQAYLNFAISLAIYDSLKMLSVPNLSIKWPNDIMSANQKICGILIETTLKQEMIKNTIIGIGLNVNQEIFPKELTNASSLKIILKKEINLESLLVAIVENIKYRIDTIEKVNLSDTHQEYHNALYKKGIPTTFLNKKKNEFFMGMIVGVSKFGNLQIQLEDDAIIEFGIKEISFAKV